MSNLEKLDLNVDLSTRKTFIDGTNLKRNILDHLSRLKKFTFTIGSFFRFSNQIDFPSNEDIQNTFTDFANNPIISSVDYFQEKQFSRCVVYTYPYQLKYYHFITNRFPGGLFECVREIRLYDEHPFEHEFFVRIQKSFPFLTRLSVYSFKAQQHKNFCNELKNNDQESSIIEYPYLTNLSLNTAHDDYGELFLDERRVRLSNNLHLNLNYKAMKRITHSFTRDVTRTNCAKLKSVCLDVTWISKYVRNYFPHTKIY